jgi:hypothetical protein
MTIILPEISRQIKSKDIFTIIEKRYSEIGPIWMPMQLEWLNSVYLTFNDYTKFMIIMHLMSKTFNFYSKNFVKLDFESFFSQNQVEIEKLNIIEISKSLNIPKETTRRKIIELEKLGTIKKLKKKIIIDKNIWPNIKPQDTIKRMSRFLSVLSKILYTEKIISESITSDELTKVSKDNFSFVWKLYYDMQMPMLLNNKAIIGDLESFHIWGLCVVNQVLNSKKNDNSQMTREGYLKKYIFSSNYKGVNAMSISEITGIPRATVIRKLNRMIKIKFLKVNNKKQYSTTGLQQKKFKEIQKINLINLSKFAERIYNLCIS